MGQLLSFFTFLLKKFRKYLHGSNFPLIFALEIQSFIKVSSFRLVKEIVYGTPVADFLFLCP